MPSGIERPIRNNAHDNGGLTRPVYEGGNGKVRKEGGGDLIEWTANTHRGGMP